MNTIKICKNCAWSIGHDILRCGNPTVNSSNAVFLAYGNNSSVFCTEEREKRGFFAKCGVKGKLWKLRVQRGNE